MSKPSYDIKVKRRTVRRGWPWNRRTDIVWDAIVCGRRESLHFQRIGITFRRPTRAGALFAAQQWCEESEEERAPDPDAEFIEYEPRGIGSA